MGADIAYWRGGVTPAVAEDVDPDEGSGVTRIGSGGDGSTRAESIFEVTIGAAGISSGLTVLVAMVGCLGSLAQSFQLLATWR